MINDTPPLASVDRDTTGTRKLSSTSAITHGIEFRLMPTVIDGQSGHLLMPRDHNLRRETPVFFVVDYGKERVGVKGQIKLVVENAGSSAPVGRVLTYEEVVRASQLYPQFDVGDGRRSERR